MLYVFLISSMPVTCHFYLILLDSVIVIVFGEEYEALVAVPPCPY
jgi:hypothetical protein